MKKATIDDVAALAGVSIKTVSRVINKEPNVRPATRDKVLAAVDELNYRPNISARSLAGNQSFLLGLLYHNPSDSYVTKIQNGVLKTCREEGYDLLIHPCNYQDPLLLDEVKNLVRHANVDGLILTPPLTDMAALRELLDQLNMPYVLISPRDPAQFDWCVSTNDHRSCAAMVFHLAELGHKRIAFILGHPDHGAIANRYAGYLEGMQKCGCKVIKSLCPQGFNSFDSGVACARKLLQRKNPPTAIFASNDDMASGVLKVAHDMDISIPGQLSVVGFDDTPLARYVWPPLTTIRQPISAMAQAASALLIKRLRGQDPGTEKPVIDSELIVRESTGPAPLIS